MSNVWKVFVIVCIALNIFTLYSYDKQIKDLRSASMSTHAEIDLLRQTIKEKTDPANMIESIFRHIGGDTYGK